MALLRTKQCAQMKEPKSLVFPVQSEPIYILIPPSSVSSCNQCLLPVSTLCRRRQGQIEQYHHPWISEVALQNLEVLRILACGDKFHAGLTCMTKQLAVQCRQAVTLLECCHFDRLILQLIQLCYTGANTCTSLSAGLSLHLVTPNCKQCNLSTEHPEV